MHSGLSLGLELRRWLWQGRRPWLDILPVCQEARVVLPAGSAGLGLSRVGYCWAGFFWVVFVPRLGLLGWVWSVPYQVLVLGWVCMLGLPCLRAGFARFGHCQVCWVCWVCLLGWVGLGLRMAGTGSCWVTLIQPGDRWGFAGCSLGICQVAQFSLVILWVFAGYSQGIRWVICWTFAGYPWKVFAASPPPRWHYLAWHYLAWHKL